MDKLPNGIVTLVNLPGSWSLLKRSWCLYKEHFAPLLYFSLLMWLGILINWSLAAFLTFIVKDSGDAARVVIELGITAVNLIAGFYFSFIFAGMIIYARRVLEGHHITVMSALEHAKGHAQSVFWIGLLLSFLLYGSLFTGILFVLFFTWYYFALYVAIVEKERGFIAIAKSRYLVHGMFMKVFGRYLTLLAVLFASYVIPYLLLGFIGFNPWVFIILLVAITIFTFPFFVIYEYLRYEDIVQVQRNVPFVYYPGEKVTVIAWTVFGFIFFFAAWSFSLLPIATQDAVISQAARVSAKYILPYGNQVQKNLDRVSEELEKLNLTPVNTLEKRLEESVKPKDPKDLKIQ